MNPRSFSCVALAALAVLVGLPSGLAAGAKKSTKTAAATTTPTNAFSPAAVDLNMAAKLPKSTFVIATDVKDGRNPFFPRSSHFRATDNIVKTPVKKALDASALVLNGITGPPRKTAMINSHTFEAGEEAEVKTAGGAKLTVKVVEILAESAIVVVGNTRTELRLRQNL